ncbi:MAG: GAF domain-containing protein [Spirochaetales bacterium]|nr:GAF domain-containing protein [Spirochaetales bacterium]
MFEPFRKSGSRETDYPLLVSALGHLLEGETNSTAALSNASALLNWFLDDINWVGFYLYDKGEEQLVLGPFQGLPACVRIPPGKGVCGRAYASGETQIVEDVLKFPGHIACDSASRSELVVPIFQGESVIAVLDIDSPETGRFDEVDAQWMEKAAGVLSAFCCEI